jgi:peptide/nickel transport system substrate-binding protein
MLIAVLVLSGLTGVITLGSRTAAAAYTPPFRSLRIGTQGWTVTTFNPMKITLVDEYIVVYGVYSTLLTNDKSYQIKGDLAYSYSLASDQKTWTFNLVHTAFFTDPSNPSSTAHPVTAADVVFTYDLQMTETASIYNTYTTDIASVTALDAYTVQIVTKRPVATMFSTAVNIPIMPEYIWNHTTQDPIKYSPSYPIGSGGFYYDYSNSTNTLAVLRKNPHFYGEQYYCEAIRPDEIRYVSYTSSGTMVNDFTTGANSLNTIIGVDPTSYTQALNTWSPKFAVDQGFVAEFSNNAMTDAERASLVANGTTQFKGGSNSQVLATNQVVRTAVAMSINKQKLIDDALLGLGHIGDSLVPDSNPWHYTPPAQYTYQFNPAQARALLNAAGWAYDSAGNHNVNATPLYQVGGTNGLIFRFYTLNTESWWQLAASDIVGWLAQAGIVTTDRLGRTTPGYGLYGINQMSGYWLSGDYDMWLWDWVFTPASDPSSDILSVETTMSIGPTSDNFYTNQTYDALYNQSVTTVDPVARRAILNEMQMMLYNYSSYIIPFYKDDLYAATTANPGGNGVAWQNWGDWGTNNGLTPDSDLLNLWQQVEPADDPAPVIVNFPQVQWINGTPATIAITVNNAQSPLVNYTFNFGDGTPWVNTTTVPVHHTYAQPGNYTVTVRVKNAEWPVCSSTTATIVEAGSVDLPPQIASFSPNVLSAQANATVWFNLSVSDPEGDPLYATWSFGDGSAAVTSYAATGTQAGVVLSKTHVFATPGTYTANVTITDNKTAPGLNHSPYVTATVTITAAGGGGGGGGGSAPVNPLIDYGIPILIVVVIVVAVVAVLMRRRGRAKKEEEQVSEQPPQSPPSPPPPP